MSKGEGRESPRPFRPIRWWMVLLGVAAVVVMTGVAWVLLTHASRGVTDAAEAAKLRVEVIRTVLTVGVGTGGAMALLLAVRRQWLNERDQLHRELVADDNRYDAAERRITDLYVKAAEQLGSEKAPVRLAGLYALERLAQDNAEHRQAIVEVICAYLRMPYTMPAERDASTEPEATHNQAEPATDKKSDTGYDPHEERQVRLAAQRILARHLRPADSSKFWPDIDIDLSGAVLMDFDFKRCSVRTADFTATTFTGSTRFGEATFSGAAGFVGATFSGGAGFGGVTFSGGAGFVGATFSGGAGFGGVTFSGDAGFGGVTFSGDAGFGGVTFSGDAGFGGVTFSGDAGFGGVTFSGDAGFGGATFSGDAGFGGATFSGDARFDGATFSGDAGFGGVTFSGDAGFGWATFSGDAWFSRATFSSFAWFGGVTFSSFAGFGGAIFSGSAGFGGATFSGFAGFDGAIFSAVAGFGEAIFSGDAGFDGAIFSSGAWFRGATLNGSPVDVDDLLREAKRTAEEHMTSESNSDQSGQDDEDQQRAGDGGDA